MRAGKDGLTVFAFVSPIARKLFSQPTTRKPNIVSLDAVEPDYEGDAGKWVVLARKAGAVRAGLNWGRLEPGKIGAQPHLHSADEEVFVILEGGGTLELWPSPVRAEGDDRMSERSTRSAPETSSGGRRAPGSPIPSARGTKESPSSPTGPGSRTTFAITPGRTRSTGGGLA